MKRFVIGDIHGAYRALLELLQKVNFDFEEDELIVLGDVVDGWSESKQCIDLLLRIKNRIILRGNHDEWAWSYYTGRLAGELLHSWSLQGGKETLLSLGRKDQLDQKYINFFNEAVYFYEEGDRLFVHANVPLAVAKFAQIALTEIDSDEFCWKREMVYEANYFKDIPNWTWGIRWKEIFVGHTPIQRFLQDVKVEPQHWGNIWLMDTGASFEGNISIMNIDTKEITQSTPCQQLYPDEKGRNRFSWHEKTKR